MFLEGDPEKDDLFVKYPELKFVPEFKELRDNFGAEMGNKILWSIAKTEDPDSKLYTSPLIKRRENVEVTYLGSPIDWEDKYIKEAISAYQRDCMHLMKKFLKIWSDKLHEATVYMGESGIEDILGGTKSQMKEYQSLYKEFRAAEKDWDASKASESRLVGNYQTSGNEDGRLD